MFSSILPSTAGCAWMLAGPGRSADAHLSDLGPHAHAGLLYGRPHQAGHEFASRTARDKRQGAARTKSKLQYVEHLPPLKTADRCCSHEWASFERSSGMGKTEAEEGPMIEKNRVFCDMVPVGTREAWPKKQFRARN